MDDKKSKRDESKSVIDLSSKKSEKTVRFDTKKSNVRNRTNFDDKSKSRSVLKKKDESPDADNSSMVGNEGSIEGRSSKGKLKPRTPAQRGRRENDDDNSVDDRSSRRKLKPRVYDAPARRDLDDDDDDDNSRDSILSERSVKVRRSKRLARKERVNYRE